MNRENKMKSQRRGAGFSLIELMVSVAILLAVMAGVFSEVAKLQKVSRDEDLKRELFQNAREFLDQFSRDVHGSGSPNQRNFVTANDSKAYVAVGLVKVGDSELDFEGDVHGDGLVSSVSYRYTAAAFTGQTTVTCPCIERAEISKLDNTAPMNQADVTGNGNHYAALQNVLAPTNTTPIFSYFDKNGANLNITTPIDISSVAGAQTISQIRSIRVFINVQAATPDLEIARKTASALTEEVKLNNY
ncbi:MAG: type II secretion system protein [Terriglobales bacterium]